MKQQGSTGGFEQASADAEKLAAELAEIRKQLSTLREQNAKFLAADPATGAVPAAEAQAVEAQSKAERKARAKGTAGSRSPSEDSAAAVSQRLKEPEMAGAPRARGGSGTAPPAPGSSPPAADPASAGSAGAEPEQGKRKWWRKPKSSEKRAEGKQSGF